MAKPITAKSKASAGGHYRKFMIAKITQESMNAQAQAENFKGKIPFLFAIHFPCLWVGIRIYPLFIFVKSLNFWNLGLGL